MAPRHHAPSIRAPNTRRWTVLLCESVSPTFGDQNAVIATIPVRLHHHAGQCTVVFRNGFGVRARRKASLGLEQFWLGSCVQHFLACVQS